MTLRLTPLPLALASLLATPALAHPPTIDAVQAERTGDSWTFAVTISHAETGWDHYADGWQVLTPDGTRLGLRVLVHPHENEQPFTRSLSGVTIPDGISQVQIGARDNTDGWTSELFQLDLPG